MSLKIKIFSSVAIFISVFLLIFGVYFFTSFSRKPQIKADAIIKTALTKQNTTIVANGSPITWTKLVERNDINPGKYLLELPKSAKNIKIRTVTSEQADVIMSAPLKEQVSLVQREKLVLSADLVDTVANTIETIANDVVNPEVILTSDAKVIDLSDEVVADSNYVETDYETPAPTITEQETDTGKLVTVSDQTETPNQPPLTDVIASTKIPEIFKIGEEDKIKIKWKNNGNQDVTFHAYDTNNNGKLDYVEWTVPHLSEQIFEIIFVSKAFKLDADKNIIDDIYDTVKSQDNNWALLENNQYIRATFNKSLTNENDNTIYAKPAYAGASAKIEVYPVYIDQDGNVTEGPLAATFENINHEDTYKVLLTGLQTSTDVFDLKIIGNVEIDYVVDPSPATLYWLGTTTSWNTATNWSTSSGGPADGWVPTSADSVVFDGGGIGNCTIDTNASVTGFTMATGYSGTITQSSNLAVSGDFSIVAGAFSCVSPDTYTFTVGGSFSITPYNSGAFNRYGALSGGYYLIRDVYDLQAMKCDLDGLYKLNNSVSATFTKTTAGGGHNWNSGAGFEPVGTSANKFIGAFDGNSKTITGLFINRSGTNDVGLFGYANNLSTSIHDVGLINVNITGAVDTGGLAGSAVIPISNCYVTGSVTGASITGGLVGWYDSVYYMTNNYTTGTVIGTTYTGGLVGDLHGAGVRYSYSSANVTGTSATGGLAGVNVYGSVTNCYATGTVNGTTKVGGLIGHCYNTNSSGTINCYATGNVTGSDINVGGLIGYTERTSNVFNSYSTGSVSGTTNVGGLIGGKSASTVNNSGWWTGSTTIPIGSGGTLTYDQPNKSDFYGSSLSGIYSQWDFSTIWAATTTYPVFLWSYPLTSVSASPNPIKGGQNITITPNGQGNLFGDPLYYYCAESTAPTSANTLCTQGNTSYATPYTTMTCTYTVASGNTTRTVYCRTFDGTVYSAEKTTTYLVDDIAPVTTASALTGEAGSYTFGNWTNSAVTVSLACDDTPGSGCFSTLYCTDTSDSCTPATSYSPVVISANGTTYIRYASTDVLSNAESVETSIIKIDATGLTVNAGVDENKRAQFTQNATVTAGISGIAGYQWSMVSGPGTITFGTATAEDTTISADTDGTYVIRLTVTDNAGTSVSDSFTLVWDTTSPSPAPTPEPTPIPATGGGGMPLDVYNKPVLPLSIFINKGTAVTSSREVVLTLQAGPDSTKIAISNNPDFTGSNQELYTSTKNWTLSEGQGTKTVYAKFFTKYGVSSSAVSASIIYNPTNSEPVSIIQKIRNILNQITDSLRNISNNPPTVPNNDLDIYQRIINMLGGIINSLYK